MTSRPALLVLIAAHLFAALTPTLASPSREVLGSATGLRHYKRDGEGYADPAAGGGGMLTIVDGTYPAGLGEPLNVIISANSDDEVLVRSDEHGGFYTYMLSTNLGQECLGQTLGSRQGANLGDGNGEHDQVEMLRWNFGNPYIGTCLETFNGGMHARYWVQNTTGAYFLATSIEMDAASGHDIIDNGYNAGRDFLIGNLTNTQVPTLNVTNQTTYSGQTSYDGFTYQTDVQYVSGLLKNSSDGINHYITVEDNGLPAIDGLVAVLTVKIVDRPAGTTESGALATISSVAGMAIVPSILLASCLTLF